MNDNLFIEYVNSSYEESQDTLPCIDKRNAIRYGEGIGG